MTTQPRPIYPKHFFQHPVTPGDTGLILMPFADEFDDVHEAIRRAIEGAGLVPFRIDDEHLTRASMEKLLRGVGEARVVVADLTGKNANVFYETGIAHVMKDNVVLLAQSIKDDVPFDLQHIDVVEYEHTSEGLLTLEERPSNVLKGLPDERAVLLVEPSTDADTVPQTMPDVRRIVRMLTRQATEGWAALMPVQQETWKKEHPNDRLEDEAAILAAAQKFIEPFESRWLPIERLGVELIEGSRHDLLRVVYPAIDAAFSATVEANRQGIHTDFVFGQPALLALRGWLRWVAAALELEEWNSFASLMSHRFSFASLYGPAVVATFPENDYAFYPEATLKRANHAAAIAFSHPGEYVMQHFLSENDYRSAVALAYFSTSLVREYKIENARPLYPGWRFGPEREVTATFRRFEQDPDLSGAYVQALVGAGVRPFNERWVGGGLREAFRTHGENDLSWWPQDRPVLPERFAER